MNRFFINSDMLAVGQQVLISDAQDVHHMLKVLRLKSGDEIEIANGSGTEGIGRIEKADKSSVAVTIESVSVIDRESPVEITLFQGLPKGQKLELVFQKNTEIGVSAFVPMVTERCVVRISDMKAEEKKAVRWKLIIDEAAKQSKRGRLPELLPVSSLEKMMDTLSDYDLILIPHTGLGTMPLKDAMPPSGIKKIAVLIGPEGGFTEEEAAAVVNAGGKCVNLGPRILRTETAGFVVSSILQYVYGDMGGNAR